MRPSHFYIEGHVYYITTIVYNRLPIFIRPSFVIPLIDSLTFYRYKQAFKFLGSDRLHQRIYHEPVYGIGQSNQAGDS